VYWISGRFGKVNDSADLTKTLYFITRRPLSPPGSPAWSDQEGRAEDGNKRRRGHVVELRGLHAFGRKQVKFPSGCDAPKSLNASTFRGSGSSSEQLPGQRVP